MKNYLDYLSQILYLLENSRKKFLTLIFFTIIISLFDIVGLSLIAPYISLVLDQSKYNNLPIINIFFEFNNYTKQQIIVLCGMIILFVYFVKTILSILINRYLLNIAFNEGSKIRANLTKSYFNMPYQDFTLRNTSEYIYTVESLTGQFANTILPALMKFISDTFIFIAIIAFLTFVNWQIIILLFSIFFSIIIFYDLFFKSSLRIAGQKSNKYLSLVVKNINESMEGIKELKIFNKEIFFLNQIKYNSEKFARNAVFSQIIANSPKYILELLLVFFVVISITITINLNMNVNELLPTLGVFAFAALRLAPASTQMISNLSVLRVSRDTLNRLYSDAIKNDTYVDNINYNINEKISTINFKKITLQNFSFKYKNTEKLIFKNANFIINKGDIIGIYGDSGIGKTTFIDILLGLLEPISGDIIINDSKDLDNYELRYSVAYLPQKVFLTDDTILNNIALGLEKNEIDYNLVNKSIVKSQLQKFIESLPDGINTNIGERGVRLSGGQKQRIALARAFYFNKQILILDESTNSLDKDTEREILNEVKKISNNITVIIVSHDKSVFNFCNKVYQISNRKLSVVKDSLKA